MGLWFAINTTMELPQSYTPSLVQQTQNTLYSNHFKFSLERLPDVSFFVQRVTVPTVGSRPAKQSTPFATIRQTGDHLDYGTFDLTFLVDAKFKTYFSLYYWMKGYGFPHDFDEVVRFRDNQRTQVGNLRAAPVNLEQTRATLTVTLPDTSLPVAEILIDGVFPIELGEMEFRSTDLDTPTLKATCTFACTTFDVKTFV